MGDSLIPTGPHLVPLSDSFGLVPSSRDPDFLIRTIKIIPAQIKSTREIMDSWIATKARFEDQLAKLYQDRHKKGTPQYRRLEIFHQIKELEPGIGLCDKEIDKFAKKCCAYVVDFQLYASTCLEKNCLSASEISRLLETAGLSAIVAESIIGCLQPYASQQSPDLAAPTPPQAQASIEISSEGEFDIAL